MIVVLVLGLAGGVARADGERFMVFGLGGSLAATDDPGWVARFEHRLDATRPHHHERGVPLVGARLGFETWDTAGHWGCSMPIGMYVGGRAGAIRTTLGGGVGLWTFERSRDQVHFGVSPFASASIEGTRDDLVLSLDGRVARQVLGERADFNVYSVMLMVGRRFAR